LFFCGALRDAGAARVTAVVPYLCYARKDRRTKPHDPITTRYVAAMFDAAGVDQVIAVEVHNVAAFENAFRCPTWHIESASLLAAHFVPLLHGEASVVVSPDAGGAKRAEQLRQTLEELTGRGVGSAYMEKFRSAGVVSGELLAGDVRGATAVIIDDLISTGGTLARAAAACRAAGATRVLAAATHGLFVGGATELFAAAAIDGIVVANTVPAFRVAPDIAASRLTVLDASDLIARAIAMSHDGG
jgi:ribose-phosphate pyrophosphokinase